MYKIKKLKYHILLILAFISFAIVNSMLAYFTDIANVENVFTIGSVEIELIQPLLEVAVDTNNNGIPDIAENIKPCDIIVEDPQVKNVGENDAYVYLKITVPAAEVILDNSEDSQDSTLQPVYTELFTYEINSSWEEIVDAKIEREDSVTHVYYYKNEETGNILKPGVTTETLYDNVKFANLRDADSVDIDQTIIVQAYAIQSNELQLNTTVENTQLVQDWIIEAQTYNSNNIPNEEF